MENNQFKPILLRLEMTLCHILRVTEEADFFFVGKIIINKIDV